MKSKEVVSGAPIRGGSDLNLGGAHRDKKVELGRGSEWALQDLLMDS